MQGIPRELSIGEKFIANPWLENFIDPDQEVISVGWNTWEFWSWAGCADRRLIVMVSAFAVWRACDEVWVSQADHNSIGLAKFYGSTVAHCL